MLTFHDVTERRKIEQLRDEYVSLISHDLRSPLTGLLGMAQLLERNLARQGLAHDAQVAESVSKSAKRMEAMIRDLVDSTQLEAGWLEMHREQTDLASLVHDVLDHSLAPENRERVRVEIGEWVRPALVDPHRMERAVTNLLTNALKYSQPETPVVVRIDQQDDNALVSIADQGLGIPAEDLPKIFQRHFRAGTAGQREGLGLGLYITRLIVEAHGGMVCSESEVGKGSTFYVSLPL